ncbi:MAG: TraR/DksA family transcriptional regulator [Myxococcota bacterium]
MALTDTELTELRAALEALARDLPVQLADSSTAARPVELDQSAVGRVSRIDAIQQQKMVEAGRAALQARLHLTRAALVRCENEEYGECVSCGEDIGFARLSARPESPFCLACQERREQR